MTAKEARQDKRLRKVYGLTLSQYRMMVAMGKGACWICRKSKTNGGKPRRLSVEHDHYNGRVRGIACFPCNFRLIRKWRHPETLRRIADYLESTFDGRVLAPGAAVPSFLGAKRSSTTPPTVPSAPSG